MDELKRGFASQTGLGSCPGLQAAAPALLTEALLCLIGRPTGLRWTATHQSRIQMSCSSNLDFNNSSAVPRMIASKSLQTDAVIPFVGAPIKYWLQSIFLYILGSGLMTSKILALLRFYCTIITITTQKMDICKLQLFDWMNLYFIFLFLSLCLNALQEQKSWLESMMR